MNDESPTPAPGRDERPSKSQRKREMHQAQDLGGMLVALDPARFSRIDLPEDLREAIIFARKVTKHEARRRQMQYIGKLMRTADVDAIRTAYEDVTGESRASVARMHHCERLRDELLSDDPSFEVFVREHPGVDTQWLSAKIRAARQERADGRPPRHARELYKWLQQLLAAA